ncbi:hypothetical protein BAE44_0010439, partial [Dichanthelium oligosanthes]
LDKGASELTPKELNRLATVVAKPRQFNRLATVVAKPKQFKVSDCFPNKKGYKDGRPSRVVTKPLIQSLGITDQSGRRLSTFYGRHRY